MATITSIGSGDWWTAGTWDVRVPLADDDVIIATGHTIVWDFGGGATIPATGSLASLIGQGTGQLTIDLSTGTRTLNVTGAITAGTANFVLISNNGNTLTVAVGTITGGSAGNAYGLRNNGGANIINITGNAVGGSATDAVGVYNSFSGTLNFVGSVTGGDGTFAQGLRSSSSGAINISNGNITGGTGRDSNGIYRVGTTNTVTITNCDMINSANAVAYSGAPPTIVTDNSSFHQWGAVKYAPQLAVAEILSGVINGDRTGTLSPTFGPNKRGNKQ